VESDDAIADYLVPETEEDIAASSKIQVRPTVAGGTEFLFPTARNPGAAVTLTTFTVVWCGIAIALLKSSAPLIFPILFGLFAVLLLYGTLWIWTGTTHIEVVRDRVSIKSGLLGLHRTREYKCNDVRTVAASHGMRSGSTQYYDIHMITTNDKKIKAGGSIKRKREAEWLAHEIESHIRDSQDSGF